MLDIFYNFPEKYAKLFDSEVIQKAIMAKLVVHTPGLVPIIIIYFFRTLASSSGGDSAFSELASESALRLKLLKQRLARRKTQLAELRSLLKKDAVSARVKWTCFVCAVLSCKEGGKEE